MTSRRDLALGKRKRRPRSQKSQGISKLSVVVAFAIGIFGIGLLVGLVLDDDSEAYTASCSAPNEFSKRVSFNTTDSGISVTTKKVHELEISFCVKDLSSNERVQVERDLNEALERSAEDLVAIEFPNENALKDFVHAGITEWMHTNHPQTGELLEEKEATSSYTLVYVQRPTAIN